MVGNGTAWQAWYVRSRHGLVRFGKAGRVSCGRVRLGLARQAWKPKEKGVMRMIYKWKTPFFKTDAEVAGKVCKELEETVGLTSKTLLDASRPEDAPLHKEFEWRDDVAAEKYREQQARTIINNLVIVAEEQNVTTRAFVVLTESKKETNKYHDVVEVMQDGEKRSALFKIALRELLSFKQKYAELEEFQKVIEAINELVA